MARSKSALKVYEKYFPKKYPNVSYSTRICQLRSTRKSLEDYVNSKQEAKFVIKHD